MAKHVLLVTLGFDTRFQIRTLVRLGGEARPDIIVVVRPESGDHRAEAAERDLIDTYTKMYSDINVKVLRVNILNIPEAISSTFKLLANLNPDSLIVDLSGGMRLLILETLAAVLLFSRLKPAVRIIVWTEDLSRREELDPRLFNLPLIDEKDYRIMEAIVREGPLTLRELTAKLSMPRSTVHARLTSLVGRGLVSREKSDNAIRYAITQLGMVAYNIGVTGYEKTLD